MSVSHHSRVSVSTLSTQQVTGQSVHQRIGLPLIKPVPGTPHHQVHAQIRLLSTLTLSLPYIYMGNREIIFSLGKFWLFMLLQYPNLMNDPFALEGAFLSLEREAS